MANIKAPIAKMRIVFFKTQSDTTKKDNCDCPFYSIPV